MSETRLYDRRNVALLKSSYRNRPTPMPRLSSQEFMSQQEQQLPTATATTPLMMGVNSRLPNNATAEQITCTNEICDCILPHNDCDMMKEDSSSGGVKFRNSTPHVIMINGVGDKFKSESC